VKKYRYYTKKKHPNLIMREGDEYYDADNIWIKCIGFVGRPLSFGTGYSFKIRRPLKHGKVRTTDKARSTPCPIPPKR